jgi:hypothetical protein
MPGNQPACPLPRFERRAVVSGLNSTPISCYS